LRITSVLLLVYSIGSVTNYCGITSVEGANQFFGDFNRDVIFGDDGQNYIDGGSGNDKIVGGASSDILIGFEGSDIIFSSGQYKTDADGYIDRIDCGPGEDEAWINIRNDRDVAINCETIHRG
jgi:Ca2+-binding RTX toxin-like protein